MVKSKNKKRKIKKIKKMKKLKKNNVHPLIKTKFKLLELKSTFSKNPI